MHDALFPLPKTFRITRGWSIFLLICPLTAILMGVGCVWLLNTLHEDPNVFVAAYHLVLAIFGLAMTPFLLRLAFDYYKSRLVVSADGLTFYGLGFRLYTPWQNILSLENGSQQTPMTVSWTSKLVGFKLRQAAMLRTTLAEGVSQGRAIIETDWWYPVSMRAPYASFFIIDEIIRERHWLQGELGAYLRHYAPQAFEGLDFMAQKERSGR